MANANLTQHLNCAEVLSGLSSEQKCTRAVIRVTVKPHLVIVSPLSTRMAKFYESEFLQHLHCFKGAFCTFMT